MSFIFGLNKLSQLRFSVSNDEVTRYKQSVMENEDVGGLISMYYPGSFTQCSDHNVRQH